MPALVYRTRAKGLKNLKGLKSLNFWGIGKTRFFQFTGAAGNPHPRLNSHPNPTHNRHHARRAPGTRLVGDRKGGLLLGQAFSSPRSEGRRAGDEGRSWNMADRMPGRPRPGPSCCIEPMSDGVRCGRAARHAGRNEEKESVSSMRIPPSPHFTPLSLATAFNADRANLDGGLQPRTGDAPDWSLSQAFGERTLPRHPLHAGRARPAERHPPLEGRHDRRRADRR